MTASSLQIRGERVLLEPFREQDITERYLSWLNDAQITRFSNQRFQKHDLQSSRAYLATFSGTDNLFLAIRVAGPGADPCIGTINAYVSTRDQTADIGIMLGERTMWGTGVGTDAWTALMRYLFEERKLRKITGGTLRSNQGMVRIFEKSGMTLEAVRKDHVLFEGHAEDVLHYAAFAPWSPPQTETAR